jgi:hypothetical protein
MEQQKMFKCEWCGKDFPLTYKLYGKNKDKIIKYCSKSCAATAVRHEKRKDFYSKKQLERNIKNIIRNKNRYTTLEEIIQELHIATKTLTKYKISILSLNKELGFKKPQSMFEFLISNYLEEIFKDLEFQKTFDDCISPKGYLLKYDFYSKSNNLLIEADGTQHYDKNNPNYNEYSVICDDIKNSYAKRNNINLIRIPYKKKVTKEYIIEHLKQIDLLDYNIE